MDRSVTVVGHRKPATVCNESYKQTVTRLAGNGKHVDLVLTSPPYNTNRKQRSKNTLSNIDPNGKTPWVRYDTVQDSMTHAEYNDFICDFMEAVDTVLSKDGVVLLNLSYGTENPDGIWEAVASVISRTGFTVADCIVWRKANAIPNNCSPNRLTRICEFVFVFARKGELGTFRSNKPVRSVRKTGQKCFGRVLNYIEAANNDGPCPLNKATFSSELVAKLLGMYATEGCVVYDPFMGTGTTLAACAALGYESFGSEISEAQCKWALDRLTGNLDDGRNDSDDADGVRDGRAPGNRHLLDRGAHGRDTRGLEAPFVCRVPVGKEGRWIAR